MIVEFSVKNILSFKDKTLFSMEASADKKLKENYINIGNMKILKSTAIYGANASGKSNLFKALANVSNMLLQSNNVDPSSFLPVVPFKLDKKTLTKPSAFEITFIENKIKYAYGFKADYRVIHEEYLYYYPNGKKTKIFIRESENEYKFSSEDAKMLNEIKSKNTANKFFLATATNWNYKKTRPAYEFLTQNVKVAFSMDQLFNYSYGMYSHDADRKLEKLAVKFLKKADFNITGYSVNEEKVTEDMIKAVPDSFKSFLKVGHPLYKVSTKHSIGNDVFELDISEESVGTKNVFSLIPLIVDVLTNKKVLIIDELDKSLHPLLVKYIIEIFNDPNMNKNGAQLIFNTHDTNILDLELLRRDQIWFAEKNNVNGASTIYSLSEFSVRNTENIEKGYLLGRYGAIPYLDNNSNPFED